MKQFSYGELICQKPSPPYDTGEHSWVFKTDEFSKTYDEPMLHKVMSDLGAKGWECIFISNNMLHAYFKKTSSSIKKPSPFFEKDK